MRLKPGVRILGVKPELLIAMMVAESCFQPDGMTITSIIDGKHSRGSDHYTGNAFDIRTRGLTEPRVREIAQDIRKRLGEDFDVVVESTHIHIEFDPKAPY